MLRGDAWRPYAELTTFAYGVDQITFQEFGRLVARRRAGPDRAAG